MTPPLPQAGPTEDALPLPLPGSDAGLVRGLRRGEPAARAALFDRYAKHVRRVLVRVIGLDGEIGDLLHEVFLTALEKVSQIENEEALKAWLTGIAVFTARAAI